MNPETNFGQSVPGRARVAGSFRKMSQPTEMYGATSEQKRLPSRRSIACT
jgi:hypothetical protein